MAPVPSDADKAVAVAEIEMSYRVELFNKCVSHQPEPQFTAGLL